MHIAVDKKVRGFVKFGANLGEAGNLMFRREFHDMDDVHRLLCDCDQGAHARVMDDWAYTLYQNDIKSVEAIGIELVAVGSEGETMRMMKSDGFSVASYSDNRKIVTTKGEEK
jgi:hypothetical protein